MEGSKENNVWNDARDSKFANLSFGSGKSIEEPVYTARFQLASSGLKTLEQLWRQLLQLEVQELRALTNRKVMREVCIALPNLKMFSEIL